MKTALTFIPPQDNGEQTDFIHEQKFENLQAAHHGFEAAAGRLLSVNNWHVYAGAGSATFTLHNNLGDLKDTLAGQGMFVSIELPVPGSDAGDGLEWVMIEQLASDGEAETAEEFVLMTVRPAPDPRKDDMQIAHFYDEVSTSTIIVRRDGLMLSAGAHGRNETPNNKSVNLHDKVRNTAIALAARIGLSGPQWQKLVKGLIDFDEESYGASARK